VQTIVRDPWGFDHCLEHDGDRWWGCENLAHGAAGERRAALIEKVVRATAAGGPFPSGYGKVVRVSGQAFFVPPGTAAGPQQLVIGAKS
jgi:hypothetical protein